jgi:hypothetical protein
MKKILVRKNETLEEVVERIIETDEDELVLVIPRNSSLKDSEEGLRSLREEAEAVGKTLGIESVDEAVLARAREAGYEVAHPLLGKNKNASFSDIVPIKIHNDPKPKHSDFSGMEKKESPADERINKFAAVSHEIDEGNIPSEDRGGSPRKGSGKWAIAVFLVVIAVGGVWAAGKYFNRTTVSIELKTASWSSQGGMSFTGDKAVGKVNPAQGLIPAEVFVQQKNFTQFFPASGKENVVQKATGRITIYNEYSSASQPLVATTRFVTPDGLIYRLTEAVTIPGARIKDGTIEPSSIQANVIADKAGPEYNRTSHDRLSIPGFSGAKHEKFYGELISAAGGYIGEKAVPTEKDINSAKETVSDILRTSLQNNLLNSRQGDFKILDGASQVELTKLAVNSYTNEKGEFSVLAEGVFRAMGFREKDVKDLLISRAVASSDWGKSIPDPVFKDVRITYGTSTIDFSKGTIKVPVRAEGEITSSFSPDEFKDRISGLDISQARNALGEIGGLKEGKISIWPFWIQTVSSNPDRLEIQIQ